MTKALALDTPHNVDAKARVERKPHCGIPNVFFRFPSRDNKPPHVAVADEEIEDLKRFVIAFLVIIRYV